MLFWNCVWSGAELKALSTAQYAEIFKEFFQNIMLSICNEIGRETKASLATPDVLYY